MMMMRWPGWWVILTFTTLSSSLQQVEDWFYPGQRCGSSLSSKSYSFWRNLVSFQAFCNCSTSLSFVFNLSVSYRCRCFRRLVVWKGEHACTLCKEICPFLRVPVWWKHWGTCMSPVSNTLLIGRGMSVGVNFTLKASCSIFPYYKTQFMKGPLGSKTKKTNKINQKKKKKWAEELYMAHRGLSFIPGLALFVASSS